MPKDNRVIVTAVRLPAPIDANRRAIGEPQTFKAGDEDELAEAATPEQIKYLLRNEAIVGDWGSAPAKQTKEPEADTGPQLTQAVIDKLVAANIEAGESLKAVSDDALKGIGLVSSQIQNVRKVYGEFEAAAPTE